MTMRTLIVHDDHHRRPKLPTRDLHVVALGDGEAARGIG
jgi:hypothetical protein